MYGQSTVNQAATSTQPSSQGLPVQSQVSIANKVVSLKDNLISTLESTSWPKRSTEAKDTFLQILRNARNLRNVPIDQACISVGQRQALENLLRVMEAVQPKLDSASQTYGASGTRLRTGMRNLLSRDECTRTLRDCRDEVKRALSALPDEWAFATMEALSRWKKNLDIIKTSCDLVEGVASAIPLVGTYIGAATKAVSKIVGIIQKMGANEETAKTLELHALRVAGILDLFKDRTINQRRGDLTTHLNRLHVELEHLRQNLQELHSNERLSEAFSSNERAEALRGYQETMRTTLEQIQLLGTLNMTELITELYDKETRRENQRLLDRLGDASHGARGNDVKEVICLEGTRVELLERINSWVRDTSPDSERVLWIRGMAGRGKSTVASTIFHQWKYKAACGIFYFRRGQNEIDNRLVCALARQLGNNDLLPDVRKSILQAVQDSEDISQKRLRDQFLGLLVQSLTSLPNTTHPILLIVDALDECKDVDYAVKVVELIEEYHSSLPVNVKFLLTTRPEAPLITALEPREWHALDLDSEEITDTTDIIVFLQQSFSKLRKQSRGRLGDSWPSTEDQKAIVDMSQGLFQWARTAIEYMGRGSPDDRLRALLNSPARCTGMDNLYHQILSAAFDKVDAELQPVFQRLLRTLVVAPYPISFETLAYLCGDHPAFRNQSRETVVRRLHHEVVVNLGSLIYIPATPTGPLQLMHTSVLDLLVDKRRCRDKEYWVDDIESHRYLAVECLRLMLRDLDTNICKLDDRSKANSEPEIQDRVRKHVPQGLQYCCRAWSVHLLAYTSEVEPSNAQSALPAFRSFSNQNLLSWLEVMGLIGQTRNALDMIEAVCFWTQKLGSALDQLLQSLWNDIQRLVTAHYEPIAFGVLHLYASALPFCPLETELWKLYGDLATTKILQGDRGISWPARIWTTHLADRARAVAFAPQGGTVAVSVEDGTIILLDAATGAPVGEPLRGHESRVTSVSFSPDGRLLASGSHDWTVRLWNAETGAPVGEPLRGHADRVTSVSFSPDGRLLASGSFDLTVRLWNAETGAPVGEPLRGHNDCVNSVSFSPDGRLLASGSDDGTVRLWNAETGAPVGEPLRGHNDCVNSVSFSPDGRLLASVSDDSTVRLWNAETGAPVGEPLRGHADRVTSVSFSPDGLYLIAETGYRQCWCDLRTILPVSESPTSDGRYNTTIWDPIALRFQSSVGDEAPSLDQAGPSHISYRAPLVSSNHSIHDDPRIRPEPKTLELAGEWVIFGSKRLLWLPAQYSRDANSHLPHIEIVCGKLVYHVGDFICLSDVSSTLNQPSSIFT